MTSTVGAAAGVAIHLLLGGLAAAATGASPDCGDGRWQAFNCLVIGAFKDSPQTRVRLVELVDGNKPIRLQLFVLREGQPDEALPPYYGNIVWSGCMIPVDDKGDRIKMPAVAVDNARSGRSDLFVVAQCTTGIGPSGAVPFPVGAIYRSAAWGGFTTDSETDGKFTMFLRNKCRQLSGCDVMQLAREFTE
jgi:hypothetical protein